MKRRTEQILWGSTVVLLVFATVAFRSRVQVPTNFPISKPPPRVMMLDPEHLGEVAEKTIAHDLFRIERKPSNIPFGTPDAPPVPPIPPVKPFQSLALKGIIGGPPWEAVFSGVPNRNNNVVARAGDTLAGLRLVRVLQDKVVLRGRDTVLTLTFNKTWQ